MSVVAAALPPALAEQMQALRACGASYHMIATTLNQRGLRGRQGGRWFAASVRRALLQTVADPAPATEK
jgi:hypothetical protein